MLLCVTISAVAGTEIVDENEVASCERAGTMISHDMGDFQFQNNVLRSYNARDDTFYAYNVYDPSGQLVEGPVKFQSDNPGNITQINQTSSIGFISGGTWATGKWYGCEHSHGSGLPLIWEIHPANGNMTQVGSYDPDDTGLSFTGLAYDTTTGIMYGCSGTDLYKVNRATGASSWVGNFGISGSIMIAIAFDGSGNLYGTELITDSLYSINPANGTATPIGSGLGNDIDINCAQDMAFDLDTGILYLSAYTIAPIKEGALYTCNTVTGVATKVDTFQGGAEITGFAIPYNYTNQPPGAPIIDGPTRGEPRVEYKFTFNATDPELDDVSYYINWGGWWGGGETEGWLGPYPSGEEITVAHAWDRMGVFTIKAKAKDVHGAEGNWSSIVLILPKNQQVSQSQSSQQSLNPLFLQILERLLPGLR